MDVGCGGQVPNYTRTSPVNPQSEFLTGQVEHSRSCECLGSCLATECLIKSSTLFECGPLPPTSISCPLDVIYVLSPSTFFASFFSVYYTERKPKNKSMGGLGMRLG